MAIDVGRPDSDESTAPQMETPMSYSFNVRAASKAEALAKVTEKLDEVVKQQSCHTVDRDQALAAFNLFLALSPEPAEGHDLAVNMNGYVGGAWEGSELKSLTTMGYGVGIGQIRRDL